jgi:hypothetical protein
MRSYRHIDSVTVARHFMFASWVGGAHVWFSSSAEVGRLNIAGVPLPFGHPWDGAQYDTPAVHRFGGFLFVHDQIRVCGGVVLAGPPIRYVAIRLPLWFVCLLTTVIPISWLLRRARDRVMRTTAPSAVNAAIRPRHARSLSGVRNSQIVPR